MILKEELGRIAYMFSHTMLVTHAEGASVHRRLQDLI